MPVKGSHHQSQRLRRPEVQWRKPDASAQPVTTISSSSRLDGDPGLAKRGDVSAGSPIGHAEAFRQIGCADPGPALDDLKRHQGAGGR